MASEQKSHGDRMLNDNEHPRANLLILLLSNISRAEPLLDQPCVTDPSLRDRCLKKGKGREGYQGCSLLDAPLASRARKILAGHHDL